MKRFVAVCLLSSLPILSACVPLAIDTGVKRALNTVELNQPDVTFTFLFNRETHRSGERFAPPKTIDCSRLRLNSDAFKDAIEAGALVVQIQTPPQVTQIVKDEDGKETTKVVKIKPTYSGVLALCKVSPRATGAESRSYRIYGLDDRFIMGKDGLISVIGGKVSHDNQIDPFQELLNINMGPGLKAISGDSSSYSWMLWLTDNKVLFTDYEAEVARRKAQYAAEAEQARLKAATLKPSSVPAQKP